MLKSHMSYYGLLCSQTKIMSPQGKTTECMTFRPTIGDFFFAVIDTSMKRIKVYQPLYLMRSQLVQL